MRGLRPMRIAYVTSQYPPTGIGGIGTFVETLARMMASRGHQVVVVSAASGHERSTRHEGGVRVERFPLVGPERAWELLSRSPLPTSRIRSAISAWNALRSVDGRFDVVEAPEWRAEGLLLRLARRGPLVVHLHIAQEVVRRWVWPGRRAGRGAVAEWLERRSVRSADAVTAASRLTTTLPGGARWLPSTPVVLVPPPLDPGDWAGCRPVEDTAPVLLFLGHRERRKAPEVAIDAAARLLTEVPELVVVFAGRTSTHSDGRSYDELLRERASGLGVTIELLPPAVGTHAVRQLYSRARVVVVPSRYETLSMVVLEGLLSARPVVMTTAVGAAELVGPDLVELVVPVGDADAVASAARPFLLDRALAAQVGAVGRASVGARCGVEQVVGEREALYRRVASGLGAA